MFENLGRLFLALVLMCLGFMVTGVVITSMWGWFVVPFGIMPISFWHAIGLSTFVGLLCTKVDWQKIADDDEREDKLSSIGVAFRRITFTLVVWGLSAIIHLFM
mgnify:CR=1 FL=1